MDLLGLRHILNWKEVYECKDTFEEVTDEFHKKCRFKKHNVQFLTDCLEHEIGPVVPTNNAWSSRQRLCTALTFYATADLQAAQGDVEKVSQFTVHQIIAKVSSLSRSLATPHQMPIR